MFVVVILRSALARALCAAKRQLNFALRARVGAVARQDVQRISCDWCATENNEFVEIGSTRLRTCRKRAETQATKKTSLRKSYSS